MGATKISQENKIGRLVTVLRTLRNVSRLLAKERSRKKLIGDICTTLVKDRGYYNAWIVLFDQSGKIIETAQTGVGNKFTSMIELWKKSRISECGEKALSSQNVILTKDPESTCRDCVLSQDYGGRGALTTKLESKGIIFGLLCVSTPKDLVADKEETKLIKEVGRDIAFALGSIHAEEMKNRAEQLLQESEDRYRGVFENSGAATVIIEAGTTFSMVNTPFEKLSGYSKPEIEGRMKWTDFVSEEDKARMLEFHQRIRTDEKSAPSEYEFRFIDKGQNEKNIFCRIGRIPGTKKSVASLIDITSLRHAEKALQESEQKLSTIMSNLPGMSYRCLNDRNRTMEYVSDGCLGIIGYKPHDLIENRLKAYSQLIHADDRAFVWNSIQNALKRKSPFKIVYRLITASGEEKWVWEQGIGIFLKEGDLVRLEGFITDITERVLSEKALKESEERFRDLIENSPVGISFIQKGKVVYRNPEQRKLFGPPAKTTVPFNMDNIHPDDVDKVRRKYQALRNRESNTFQTEFRFFPEGKSRSKPDIKWVDCRANRVKYKGEDAILVNMLDISRSKELEHFLMIQDKMASLGHLAAGIAHEIRNPLSGINIYLNTLEKRIKKIETSDKELEIIEQIKSASYKIESVIRRVMDFSKPGEPKLILSNINEPIDEAVKLASVTLRKSNIKIDASLGENMPLCLIDPPLIEEVLLNLITNAADAMKELGTEKKIEIVSSKANDFIEINVSDSGPGVPFHLRTKIFDPFYTSKSDSSGIGLSISHRIVTDHGGSIDVGTSKWGGAEFKLRIPIKKGKN